jgi:hypothetical protein
MRDAAATPGGQQLMPPNHREIAAPFDRISDDPLPDLAPAMSRHGIERHSNHYFRRNPSPPQHKPAAQGALLARRFQRQFSHGRNDRRFDLVEDAVFRAMSGGVIGRQRPVEDGDHF